MRGLFRELFDVLTFYKPIMTIVQEEKPILNSIITFFLVFFTFFVPIILLVLAFNFSSLNIVLDKGLGMLLLFLHFFINVPLSSVVVFFISRVFTKEGNLVIFMGTNFFVMAGIIPFFLMVNVPLAEFAGLIFMALGIFLYFYFIFAILESMFKLSPLKTFFLWLIYFAMTPILLFYSGLTILSLTGI
ncbi:MAG: hypothetical protein COV47_02115 [Candidatus Diapherotrites archaeon CG11_big_fil_rev_8_21_14_0_20_37_9]|nr:MAG: hypothetical protein COV47_02115 [Candidatus Diapherotrites archaeon CG11_big_fil_rev_8_21_14_0_20_37_9]